MMMMMMMMMRTVVAKAKKAFQKPLHDCKPGLITITCDDVLCRLQDEEYIHGTFFDIHVVVGSSNTVSLTARRKKRFQLFFTYLCLMRLCCPMQ